MLIPLPPPSPPLSFFLSFFLIHAFYLEKESSEYYDEVGHYIEETDETQEDLFDFVCTMQLLKLYKEKGKEKKVKEKISGI